MRIHYQSPGPTLLLSWNLALRLGTVADDAAPKNHIDDEYAKVGTYDPKVVITTSRSPSSRLLQFSKVSLLLPAGRASSKTRC